MASYEEHEGKKNAAIGNYFRSDYIGWQVLKSIISATIAFVVVFGMYIFLTFSLWMVGIYAVISYIVYTVRYNAAVKSLRVYHMNLRRLADMYRH